MVATQVHGICNTAPVGGKRYIQQVFMQSVKRPQRASLQTKVIGDLGFLFPRARAFEKKARKSEKFYVSFLVFRRNFVYISSDAARNCSQFINRLVDRVADWCDWSLPSIASQTPPVTCLWGRRAFASLTSAVIYTFACSRQIVFTFLLPPHTTSLWMDCRVTK